MTLIHYALHLSLAPKESSLERYFPQKYCLHASRTCGVYFSHKLAYYLVTRNLASSVTKLGTDYFFISDHDHHQMTLSWSFLVIV